MGHVLVVDDHLDSCKVLMRVVSSFNGPADCVSSGAEALRYVQSQQPKLIFLDWMMPEMSGLEVLRALHQNPDWANVPVIIYSALSDPSVKASAMEAGAQGFIVKGDYDQIKLAIKNFA